MELPNNRFFSDKFSENGGETFKWPYFNMIQSVMVKIFQPRNQWKYNVRNGKSGIMINGWDSLNRVNTNPVICRYFCENISKTSPSIIDNIGYNRYDRVVEQIREELLNNQEKYFPISGETKESKEISNILSRSWLSGNLSLIDAIYGLKLSNPNIDKFEFGFEMGKSEDLKGTDLVSYIKDSPTTYQIKGGKHNGKLYGDYYYVNGATNTLDYKCDQYIYTSYNNNEMSVFIFNNVKNDRLLSSVKKEKSTAIKVHKDIINFNYQGHMPITEKIHEISIIVANKNWSFNITSDGDENYIKIKENEDGLNSVCLNFIDPNDDTLENKIDCVLKELKNLR